MFYESVLIIYSRMQFNFACTSIWEYLLLKQLLFNWNHDSFWFPSGNKYSLFLKEDIFIRNFFAKNLVNNNLCKISIERKLISLVITLFFVKSDAVDFLDSNNLADIENRLNVQLLKNFGLRNIVLKTSEITKANSQSNILARFISQGLEKRIPFRRVIKNAILKAKASDVKGVKIQVSGRLNGAEIARTEWVKEGRVPLHTLDAYIDYTSLKALFIFKYVYIFFLFLVF